MQPEMHAVHMVKSFPEHHAVKLYTGVEKKPRVYKLRHYMEVNVKFHASAALSRK
jgi:hypothetical protein